MEHLEFKGMTEVARYLDTTPRIDGCGDFSIREQSDFECPMTWDAAIQLARTGGYWAEGADKMVQGVADAAALRENHAQPMLHNDVAGFMPDVPAYLAGVPDNMVAYAQGDMTTSQTPTITIGVGTFSWGVDSKSVMNRGIAILSLIDAVEAIGYRVQLDYVGDNKGSGGLKKIRVVLKEASQHWNAGSVAFAIAHAGMLRRLTVGLLERDADDITRTQAGYGIGDNGYLEEYSLAFEYMTSNDGYETLEEALRSVESMAQDFGMEVNLGGGA